jgi:hypothetical protein
MKWLISLLVTLSVVAPAEAQLTAFSNTQAFWALCGPNRPSESTVIPCAAYLAGIIDMQRTLDQVGSGARLCVPTEVASITVLAVMLKFLDEQPHRRVGPTAAALIEALSFYYPCKNALPPADKRL